MAVMKASTKSVNPTTSSAFFWGSTFTSGIGRDRFHSAPALRVVTGKFQRSFRIWLQNALDTNLDWTAFAFERKEWHSSTAMVRNQLHFVTTAQAYAETTALAPVVSRRHGDRSRSIHSSYLRFCVASGELNLGKSWVCAELVFVGSRVHCPKAQDQNTISDSMIVLVVDGILQLRCIPTAVGSLPSTVPYCFS